MRKIATIKERILQYLEFMGTTKYECYRNTGMTNGVLSKKEGLSEDNLLRFISYYKEVNPGWLLTGEGEMLVSREKNSEKNFNSKCAENVLKKNEDIFEDAFEDKRKMQKTWSNNTSTEPPFPDHTTEMLNPATESAEKNFNSKCAENVTLSKGNIKGNKIGNKRNMQKMLPNEKVIYADTYSSARSTPADVAADMHVLTSATGAVSVPVVDIDAAAGGGAVNSDYFDETEMLRFPSSILSPTSSKRLCINVRGESMEPTIFDGTRIVVRLLDRSEWARIRSGDVYVVTDREGNTFVKRIRNNLDMFGFLTLISDNPNQQRYNSFQLAEDDIFNVWTVELVISDSVPPSERDQIDDLRDEMRELRAWMLNALSRKK